MTSAISSVFAALGLDTDELEWADLALCAGYDISRFYEAYESNPRVAKLTDQMCLSCPVRKECLQTGVEKGLWGVWGGVYLSNGKVDVNRNSHKTQDVWDQIREGLE